MEAATRQIPSPLNATGENAANEVDVEAGIPYYCPAQRYHSHHNEMSIYRHTKDQLGVENKKQIYLYQIYP
jgi:hypothetical protein